MINYRLRFGAEGGESRDNSEDDVEFHRSSSSSSLLAVTNAVADGVERFILLRLVEDDFRPSDALLFSPGIFLAPDSRGFNIDGNCMLNK